MTDSADLDSARLHRFPHVRTRSLDELARSILPHYGRVEFEARGPQRDVSVTANHCNLNDMSLTWARHGTAVEITLPSFDYVGQLFAFAGSATVRRGSKELDVSDANSFIANAGETYRLSYRADFEQFVLKFAPEALIRKLEALTNASVTKHLRFSILSKTSLPGVDFVYRTAIFLAERINQSTELHRLALAEFEDLILVSFLCGNSHNFSGLLHQEPLSITQQQVSIAEEYIRANWDQPITIESLAVVAGSSARNLFHQFRKTRGYSPKTFVKRTRLMRARQMLKEPHSTTSVTDVAYSCGFGNLGHFSRYYSELFGEHPSFTLRSAKSAGKARKGLSL